MELTSKEGSDQILKHQPVDRIGLVNFTGKDRERCLEIGTYQDSR